MPKRNAPTGRKASVRKSASATAEACAWKSAAIDETQKTRMKKSKASRDQPRKQATNACFCCEVRFRKGLGMAIRGNRFRLPSRLPESDGQYPEGGNSIRVRPV